MSLTRPIYLASGSPRRRHLLAEASIAVEVAPPDVDDGLLRPDGVAPEAWVIAMAFLKGRRVADRLREEGVTEGTVLAADTMCVQDGLVQGQPADVEHARRMLEAFRDSRHVTMTGVCLIDLGTGERSLFVDRSEVIIGDVSDDELEAYLASAGWQGKAGAYSLQDRIDAGWPIECRGDPATVMGLPMRRLEPMFAAEHLS